MLSQDKFYEINHLGFIYYIVKVFSLKETIESQKIILINFSKKILNSLILISSLCLEQD